MMKPPAQAFVDAMTKLGLSPTVEAGLVICRITPAAGARAGNSVEVGVSVDELGYWPQAPPHWIHLPPDIKFASTNSQDSPKAGWLQHSRNSAGWGDAPPEVCWTAHLQAVLSRVTQ